MPEPGPRVANRDARAAEGGGLSLTHVPTRGQQTSPPPGPGAFAYVDSRGRRRLPIHDEAHVRNALARFSQVGFEDDAARERARKRLLNAAKKYGIVPVGFITGQLQSERSNATAGRLVIELGRHGAPGELEQRLRSVLRDPTLAVLHWSDASGAYLDGTGKPRPASRRGRPARRDLPRAPGPADDGARARPDGPRRPGPRRDRAGRRALRRREGAPARPDPGHVDRRRRAPHRLRHPPDDRHRGVHRPCFAGWATATATCSTTSGASSAPRCCGPSGREIDARADEYFAVFERPAAAIEAAVAIQRALGKRAWPDDLDVRVRVGIHSGRPTLTDVGYIGLAVHTTARVCSAAHGGQIVVSAATRAAVGTSAPAGLRFRSLGRHRLPGLPDAETLFQVAGEGAPESLSTAARRAWLQSPRSPRPARRSETWCGRPDGTTASTSASLTPIIGRAILPPPDRAGAAWSTENRESPHEAWPSRDK